MRTTQVGYRADYAHKRQEFRPNYMWRWGIRPRPQRMVGKLPPRTERLTERRKNSPLIKSFAELSFRKATVSLARRAANRPIYAPRRALGGILREIADGIEDIRRVRAAVGIRLGIAEEAAVGAVRQLMRVDDFLNLRNDRGIIAACHGVLPPVDKLILMKSAHILTNRAEWYIIKPPRFAVYKNIIHHARGIYKMKTDIKL